MVGWEKPVTRYNKNNNNKNNNKNLHCHMHKDTYAGDREWLNARGKKSLRSARLHLCSLSLASLLLRSLALSINCHCTTIFTNSTNTVYCTVQRSLPLSVLAVQRSLPSVSDRHIYIYNTLAQIQPPMLQDYSPHAKALGNYIYTYIYMNTCGDCLQAGAMFGQANVVVSHVDHRKKGNGDGTNSGGITGGGVFTVTIYTL